MPEDTATDVAAGRSALAEGDWARAREAFTAALSDEESPEALLGLAQAAWWLGDLEAALTHRERAYAILRRGSEPMLAAAVALRLCFDHRKHAGNAAAASGWLARARRLVTDNGLEPLRGHLALMESYDTDDHDAAETWAREALAIAGDTGDLDLELRAVSQLGAALIAQGEVEQGVAHLDEAMAGALAEEGSDLDTVVFASCNMIVSCTSCAEFERAVQWIRATERFSDRYGCPFLLAECRTFYGAVLVATGDWERAEDELAVALEMTRDAVPTLHREALAALAELRIAQGRQEAAESLVADQDGHPETAAVVARLHLLRGEPERAIATVHRHLGAVTDRLGRAHLLELLGEAELAATGSSDPERGADLVRLGEDTGCGIVRARGHRLLGRTLAAAGQSGDAGEHLAAAHRAFTSLNMPYEAARTRLDLAQWLSGRDPDQAVEEARTCLRSFERLGARRDADRAAELLRSLGVPAARTRRRGDGGLTDREQEVLVLLAAGLSNPDIAERLFISRKTVEHHVSHVLRKLGVRNRVEAVTVASDEGLLNRNGGPG